MPASLYFLPTFSFHLLLFILLFFFHGTFTLTSVSFQYLSVSSQNQVELLALMAEQEPADNEKKLGQQILWAQKAKKKRMMWVTDTSFTHHTLGTNQFGIVILWSKA